MPARLCPTAACSPSRPATPPKRQAIFCAFACAIPASGWTTAPASRGTGLGLATVFGVVTQSGGHLSVASEPGRGAAFNLHFPRLTAPAGLDPATTAAGRAAGHQAGTVLLVEDQADLRRLACTILRNMGFTV